MNLKISIEEFQFDYYNHQIIFKYIRIYLNINNIFIKMISIL